jgi:hypothetical protein
VRDELHGDLDLRDERGLRARVVFPQHVETDAPRSSS